MSFPETKLCFDLFSGAGGLSEGLRQAGFTSVFSNEISPAYSSTMRSNHPETELVTDDIRSLDAEKIRKQLSLSKGELDLICGGPPCQGFSVNAPVRSIEDKRNHLFLDFLRFVEALEPKTVLIENVPGMVSFERGQTVTAILSSLKDLGYNATIKILFAPHYGVPQMRWRTIILANRKEIAPYLLYPHPTNKAFGRANFTTKYQDSSLILNQNELEELPDHISIKSAIGDLPPINNGGGENEMSYISSPKTDYQKYSRNNSTTLYNHRSAGLGNANLERLPHIPPGGSWRDIPFELLPNGMKKARRSDHTKRYGRLHPDRLGSTILTKCDPHWGTFIHYNQDRIISVREAARIQSFPDHYQFSGSLSEQYEQVGNAVPPLLAKAIGLRILECLNGELMDSTEHSIWHAPQKELIFA